MARCFRFSVVAVLFVIGGCGGTRAPSPEQPSAIEAAERAEVGKLWDQRVRGGTATDLCLGPGDLIEVTVFRYPEMQALRTRVSSTGVIELPLIGTVTAAGRTERQLRDDITKKLGEKYLRDPQVTVFVAENASQQVSVTGAVARPGLIGISRDNRTVADLLSEAGGLSEQAGGTVLFYPATGDGCSGVRARPAATPGRGDGIEIDLGEPWDPPQQNPLHLPVVGGDTLVVSRGRYYVDGWVNKPGFFDIAPGTTAFGGVSAAGGALFPADLSGVTVWRTRHGNRTGIPVDMAAVTEGKQKDVTLQAGDVVYVPASPIRMVPYSGFWLVTNVFRIGAGLSLGF